MAYVLSGVYMLNLIAHRGNNNHDYPENSLPAFLSSLKEDYIQGIELDVRLTKDKKIVVIHDYTINRTSNGSGIVKNMTLKELKKYKFGNKHYTYTIMTLDEVLKKIRSPKLIIIEIKHEMGNIKELVKKVMKVVKKYKHLNIYFTGFSEKLTKYIKKNYPNYKTGRVFLIVGKNISFDDNYDAYFIRHNFFKKYKTKKPLFFWTINNPSFFDNKKRLIEDNMYFITDKAYLLKNVKLSR